MSVVQKKGLDRRAFLKLGAASAAGLAMGRAALAAEAGAGVAAAPGAYRVLGRTGLKISAVSFGALMTSEPAVFQAAFDMGVNYVDTARVYMDGRNEAIVCKALQGYRDKVYLATKVFAGPKEVMVKAVDESLAALKVDHVDMLMVHRLSSKEVVMDPVARGVMIDARKQGKTRFIGVSTHENEAAVVNAIVDDPEKLFDAVLVQYNFKSPPEVKQAIARAGAANVGVIAMKTQMGGYATKELGDISPHQAALKWVLQDKNVAAAVPSMVNLDQIKEDVAVMGMLGGAKAVSRADEDLLLRYAEAIAPYYCYRCQSCGPTCPRGVDVATVNRCLMYAEGYRDLKLACSTYRELPAAAGVSACRDCERCVARCAHGLDLAERMACARAVFA